MEVDPFVSTCSPILVFKKKVLHQSPVHKHPTKPVVFVSVTSTGRQRSGTPVHPSSPQLDADSFTFLAKNKDYNYRRNLKNTT
ncbi:hypothetical protein J4Q44_G00060130 [Coregonus suidteri]|uniref:Uncharacterized protein n=1 Tax=Coregonus suidteri TaxID=861788 RepID=A0AAN8R501_9TELE